MPRPKGVSAPFFFAEFVSSRRNDALLTKAAEDFRRGRHADALVVAESVCRALPGEAAPAVLRAKVLDACRPTMAPRAWMAAWSRDPLNSVLQDAMLSQWLKAGNGRRVAEQGVTFLPDRCRARSDKPLLEILARAGVARAGCCWRDGDAIEVRCFELAGATAGVVQVVLGSDDGRLQVHEVPTDTGLRLHAAVTRGVYSLAFDDGALLQGSPLSFDTPARSDSSDPIEPGVDIIIPVYRGSQTVQACVRSVLESLPRNRTPARVLVVNDASPEPELVLWLESLVARGMVEVVHNRFNLGFIESMNRALARGRRNALMLNADTLVHGDWIDRLAAALETTADVASVMPWSNNAEIGSLAPARKDAPCTAADVARIDTFAARLHGMGKTTDMQVPTTIGFAMLMRRTVLDRIGLLDGAALTRGYLEEVDWCQRARGAGFRHLLATSVFVGHKGSASFGPEKQLRVRQNRAVIAARYPRYYAEYSEFLRRDPLRDPRRKLLDALASSGSTWPGREDTARPRIDTRAALDSSVERIAVWGLHLGSDEEVHVLALARRIASARNATPSRLLVFGEASEALLHTGVVDVILPSRSSDEPLPDEVLASLAGCKELLLADDAVAAPEGIASRRISEELALMVS